MKLIKRQEIQYNRINYSEKTYYQLYEHGDSVYYFLACPEYKIEDKELTETGNYEIIMLCNNGLFKATMKESASKQSWRFSDSTIKRQLPTGMEKLISDFLVKNVFKRKYM